jgi:hypothetical protein
MNLIDLRDVLDDRSHPARIPAGLERMSGVRARVSAIRQRRAVAIAAFGVVVLVIIGYGLLPPDGPHPGLAVSHPAPVNTVGYSILDGFPEYANGAEVVATASASTRVGVLRVAAAATSLGFVFVTRCQLTGAAQLSLRWAANGNTLNEGSCGATFQAEPTLLRSIVTDTRGRIEFEVTVAHGGRATVPDGTFSVAVMRRLDYATYPFPPRPGTLAPLARYPGADQDPRVDPDTGRIIDSVAANPDAPVEVSLPVPPNAVLDMVAQTPGFLLVYADGLLQARGEWWDYDQSVSGTSLRVGEKGTRLVTLRLVPEHVTGAWRAVLYSGQP